MHVKTEYASLNMIISAVNLNQDLKGTTVLVFLSKTVRFLQSPIISFFHNKMQFVLLPVDKGLWTSQTYVQPVEKIISNMFMINPVTKFQLYATKTKKCAMMGAASQFTHAIM